MKDRVGLVAAPEPNWQAPVEVEYNFRTSVLTARDGSEQREALRQTPRILLSHQMVLTRAQLYRHMGDVAAGQDRVFVVPTRWRRMAVTAASAGVLTVEAAPFWAVPGQPVVVADDGTEEASEITAVSGTDLTVATTLESPAAIYFAYEARMDTRVRFDARTDDLWTGQVQWAVDPGSDPGAAPAISPDQFEGRDLFLTRPNWSDRPRVEFGSDRETLDHNVGVIAVRNPVAYSHEVAQFGYTQFSALAAEELIAFFARQKGKRGEFWAPTWRSDMRAAAPAASGATTLTVAGEDIGESFFEHPVYNVIHLAGQTVRVTDMTISGGNTVLTLGAALAADVTARTMISWCPLRRFSADRLEVSWLTDQAAEIAVSLRSLPNDGGSNG